MKLQEQIKNAIKDIEERYCCTFNGKVLRNNKIYYTFNTCNPFNNVTETKYYSYDIIIKFINDPTAIQKAEANIKPARPLHKELTKEMLLSYGLSFTEDPNEPSGWLVTRYGQINRSPKEYLKKITPVIQTKKHKYGSEKQYYTIAFSHNGKIIVLMLSRCVWAWVNGICPADKDVDHGEGGSLDNRIENLSLLSRRENLEKRGGNCNQYGKKKRQRVYEELPHYIYKRILNGTYSPEEWDRYMAALENKKEN